MDGPGRFYLAGPNADFVDLGLLNMCLQDMVKMSPLQGSFFEIVGTSHDLALIGAASSAIGGRVIDQRPVPFFADLERGRKRRLHLLDFVQLEAAGQQHSAGPQDAQQVRRERDDRFRD